MSRAHELLPIPDRNLPEEPMPGLELTDRHHSELEIGERFVPGPTGEPDVRVVVYRPRALEGRLPILFHIHGGAFCIMHPESFAGMEANWALGHGCVVVSVDYRLAPEHPFPAAPDDCYAALQWVGKNADELGIDLNRLVVTGGSAGGALTEGKYAPHLRDLDPVHIYGAMVTGPQNMPVFNDMNLTPEQKNDVITYLKYLDETPSVGGFSLGSLGPVSEGLFVWLIGLGGLIAVAIWLTARSN